MLSIFIVVFATLWAHAYCLDSSCISSCGHLTINSLSTSLPFPPENTATISKPSLPVSSVLITQLTCQLFVRAADSKDPATSSNTCSSCSLGSLSSSSSSSSQLPWCKPTQPTSSSSTSNSASPISSTSSTSMNNSKTAQSEKSSASRKSSSSSQMATARQISSSSSSRSRISSNLSASSTPHLSTERHNSKSKTKSSRFSSLSTVTSSIIATSSLEGIPKQTVKLPLFSSSSSIVTGIPAQISTLNPSPSTMQSLSVQITIPGQRPISSGSSNTVSAETTSSSLLILTPDLPRSTTPEHETNSSTIDSSGHSTAVLTVSPPISGASITSPTMAITVPQNSATPIAGVTADPSLVLATPLISVLTTLGSTFTYADITVPPEAMRTTTYTSTSTDNDGALFAIFFYPLNPGGGGGGPSGGGGRAWKAPCFLNCNHIPPPPHGPRLGGVGIPKPKPPGKKPGGGGSGGGKPKTPKKNPGGGGGGKPKTPKKNPGGGGGETLQPNKDPKDEQKEKSEDKEKTKSTTRSLEETTTGTSSSDCTTITATSCLEICSRVSSSSSATISCGSTSCTPVIGCEATNTASKTTLGCTSTLPCLTPCQSIFPLGTLTCTTLCEQCAATTTGTNSVGTLATKWTVILLSEDPQHTKVSKPPVNTAEAYSVMQSINNKKKTLHLSNMRTVVKSSTQHNTLTVRTTTPAKSKSSTSRKVSSTPASPTTILGIPDHEITSNISDDLSDLPLMTETRSALSEQPPPSTKPSVPLPKPKPVSSPRPLPPTIFDNKWECIANKCELVDRELLTSFISEFCLKVKAYPQYDGGSKLMYSRKFELDSSDGSPPQVEISVSPDDTFLPECILASNLDAGPSEDPLVDGQGCRATFESVLNHAVDCVNETGKTRGGILRGNCVQWAIVVITGPECQV